MKRKYDWKERTQTRSVAGVSALACSLTLPRSARRHARRRYLLGSGVVRLEKSTDIGLHQMVRSWVETLCYLHTLTRTRRLADSADATLAGMSLATVHISSLIMAPGSWRSGPWCYHETLHLPLLGLLLARHCNRLASAGLGPGADRAPTGALFAHRGCTVGRARGGYFAYYLHCIGVSWVRQCAVAYETGSGNEIRTV